MENLPVEELSSKHNPAAAGEDLCRLIFNHTELSLILLDQQLRIIECNPFALRKAKVMLGIDVVPGMSILEMAPPERHEPLRKLYEEVFHGETKKADP